MDDAMRDEIVGVILAGGLSRRMGGGDKTLLPLGGRPILAHVADRLARQVQALALSANGDASRFAAFGLPVVSDSFPSFAGPLAGVLAGLEWASAGTRCQAIVTAAGDTPFLPADLVERLVRAAEDRPGSIAVAASAGRRHPVCALWPLAVRGDLAGALAGGERRVSAYMGRHPFVEADFPMAQFGAEKADPFFNINTPGDLAEAERLLRSMIE
jgi:molybdopterin-guanine dinucleotide biosynthesis protein A